MKHLVNRDFECEVLLSDKPPSPRVPSQCQNQGTPDMESCSVSYDTPLYEPVQFYSGGVVDFI